MDARLIRAPIALALGVLVVAGPLPGDGAAASCSAPYLRVVGGPGSPDSQDTPGGIFDSVATVVAGSTVSVEGRAFAVGCNDGGSSTAWGCETSEPEVERPMKNVELRIRQGAEERVVGAATDAGTATQDRLGQLVWTVRVPGDLKPGPAMLVADGSDPLKITVRAR